MKPAVRFTRPAIGERELYIPLRLMSEANQREHHMVKARRVKVQRKAVRLALATMHGHLGSPALPLLVTITRIAPRGLDSDNLVGSAKAVRDAIADWFGVDDGGPQIAWNVEQGRGDVGEYAVEVLLREVKHV